MFDVPPAHPADVRMRARPDPPPVAAGPVGQVVPAAGRLVRGPVRHLVPGQPGRGQRGVGQQVAVGEHVLVGHRQQPGAHLPGQPGAGLDDQRVGRDVIDPAVDGGPQRVGELGVGLPRCAVDQVEIDVLEARRPGPADHLAAPGRRCASGPGSAAPASRSTACRATAGCNRPPAAAPAAPDRSTPGWPRWSPRRPGPARTGPGSRPAARSAAPAPTSDGVPPPTNTVDTCRCSPPAPSTFAARSISASAASSQDCGDAAEPSSPAV